MALKYLTAFFVFPTARGRAFLSLLSKNLECDDYSFKVNGVKILKLPDQGGNYVKILGNKPYKLRNQLGVCDPEPKALFAILRTVAPILARLKHCRA